MINYIETMFTQKYINSKTKVNSKQVKYHQKVKIPQKTGFVITT